MNDESKCSYFRFLHNYLCCLRDFLLYNRIDADAVVFEVSSDSCGSSTFSVNGISSVTEFSSGKFTSEESG